VFLAAFFKQADPQAAVLPVNVFHSHAERRADTGEGENQQSDQRPVAQADDRLGVDAVEELAGFGRRQYRGLAGPDNVFGAAQLYAALPKKSAIVAAPGAPWSWFRLRARASASSWFGAGFVVQLHFKFFPP